MKRKMTVLIADDSPAIVERLTEMLKEIPGLQYVGEAQTVQETIRIVQEKRPDALILDLQMPGGSGLDVLRAIRPKLPALRVLVCTNYSTLQHREECVAAGSDSFVDKSTEFEKIPEILSDWYSEADKTWPIAL